MLDNNPPFPTHIYLVNIQALVQTLFIKYSKLNVIYCHTGRDLISALYGGVVVNQIKCLQCLTVKEREEAFNDLTVPVQGRSGLTDRFMVMVVNNHVFRIKIIAPSKNRV